MRFSFPPGLGHTRHFRPPFGILVAAVRGTRQFITLKMEAEVSQKIWHIPSVTFRNIIE